jgi:hypothetical protein
VFVLAVQAAAIRAQGSGQEIWGVFGAGSSVDLNPGGDPDLQDLKGYPFGHPFIGADGTTIWPGLGGLAGTLAAVVEVPTLEEGAVILSIERVSDAPGSAIRVSWELNQLYTNGNELVDIYYATGDGSGQYPAAFTQLIVNDNNVQGVADVSADGSNAFQWDGQVAGGEQEIYFKGCIDGYAQEIGVFGLSGNVAVGKVNVTLGGESGNPGKNLVSVPFFLPITTISDVFGDGADAPWQEGDLIQYKFAPSPAYLSAVYSSNAWRDAANTANDPQFEADFRFGNWIIVTGPRDICLVGKVPNFATQVTVYDGAGLSTGGKTLLGMVYPLTLDLANSSLIADGAGNGDLIQYKVSPLNQVYISAVVSSGEWKNAANTSQALDPNIATLKVPNSYIFVKYGNTGFIWNRVAP